MNARLRAVLPHTVMLVVSVGLYAAAAGIDAGGATGGRLGPDAWPKAVIVAMAALCAFEIVRRLLAGPDARPTGDTGTPAAPARAVSAAGPDPSLPQAAPSLARLAGGIALVAAYVAFVPALGFFVATALFLALFTLLGGVRRPGLATLIGVAGAFVLVVVFMRVAYVSLPLGTGPFKSLSVLLLRMLGV